MPEQIDYTATCDYLKSLNVKGVKYGLDSIRSITATLGHPEKKFPCIHVAGTNGKGSTCAMLEAIYRANGYKTGLYTSPHLIHEGEMIQIGRRPLSEIDIIVYVKQLKSVIAKVTAEDSKNHPSFFELMTVMAFLHFAESRVDLALFETGVGGRSDATNVVEPALSIITSISLDHTYLLGNTIEQIAREKAGIIKPGRPVLIGKLSEAAEAVIRKVADDNKSKLYSIRDRFPNEISLPETNLAGTFQRWNAAIATHATEILNSAFPVEPAKTSRILKEIYWPGRWQTIKLESKTIILDTTHNAEGAEMLKENLNALIKENQLKPIIVAGTTTDLRARSLVPIIADYARKLYLVTPQQPNATSSQTLEKYIPDEVNVPVSHTEVATLFPKEETCTAGDPGDTIVVTGSIYLIGEVLRQLNYPRSKKFERAT